MKCKYFFMVLFVFILVGFIHSEIRSSSIENITVEDWVDSWRQSWAYEAIDRLSSRGLITDFFLEKPISYKELEKSIDEAIEKIKLGKKPDSLDSYYLSRLIYYYMPEGYKKPEGITKDERLGRPPNSIHYTSEGGYIYFSGGAQLLPILDKWKTDRNGQNASIETILQGGVDIGDKITFAGRWRIRQYFGDHWLQRYTSPDYFLRTRAWITVAPAEKGYVNMKFSIFSILFGRDELQWGPGYRSNMLISSSSPTFDMLKVRAEWKRNKIEFFTALLDPSSSTYISGHRFDLGVLKWLDISIAEVVYYTAKGPCLYYMNPFLPYYFIQWAEGDPDNILIEFNTELRFIPNTRIYSTIMIDDYYKERIKELLGPPHKVGIIVGLQYTNPFKLSSSNLRIEYCRVTPGTYLHWAKDDYYLYRGMVPGYYQESDSDNLLIEFTKMVYSGIFALGGINFERKGEWSAYTDVLPQDWDRRTDIKFLSGIVQKGWTLSFGFNIEPLLWRFDTAFRFDLLRYDNVKNVMNRTIIDNKGFDIKGYRTSLLIRFTL
ncbi:MAG: capsule assembly Wzi family protein [bacterium]